MIISKSCIYAIQAAIFVAAESKQGYVPINIIADRLNISFHFLTKVLQDFTHSGLMISYRGPRGGVALAKPADEITLHNLVEAIDGTDIFTECMLGLPGCGTAEPCPTHEHWIEVRQRFTVLAQQLTLKDMATKSSLMHVRLANGVKHHNQLA
ncbi:MAG: Rrf2 family transcriptional regulator [Ignavibacteria bacterium]|nr:Rrf2 family transcriptional regulator [Ignavibacteria bacterium]